MRRLLQSAICAALLVASASAADMAMLANGFSIRHERREVMGEKTRLYLDGSQSSFVDVLTSEITGFEPDTTPAPEKPATAAPAKSIQDHISDASKTHGIDPDFIASVIRSESSSNPKAVSPKGAQGLMQLMPQTAQQLGVKDSFDPAANIDGGTRYLRQLLEQYNGDAVKALAAYNAGPHRVEQYHGVPPYSETRAYVSRTIREYNKRKLAEQKAAKTKSAKTPASAAKPAAKSGQKTTASATTSRKPA